jgi:hypothetical protein
MDHCHIFKQQWNVVGSLTDTWRVSHMKNEGVMICSIYIHAYLYPRLADNISPPALSSTYSPKNILPGLNYNVEFTRSYEIEIQKA